MRTPPLAHDFQRLIGRWRVVLLGPGHTGEESVDVIVRCRAGIGASIVPEKMTRLIMPGVRILPLDQPEMVSELSLISRTGERSSAVLHFIKAAHGWG